MKAHLLPRIDILSSLLIRWLSVFIFIFNQRYLQMRSIQLVGAIIALVLSGMWIPHAWAQETEELRLTVARIHVGGDDERSDIFKYTPPDGYRIADYNILENSKYGDASYSAQLLPDGTLQIPWQVKSHTVRGPFNVVMDTKTANLELDVRVTIAHVEVAPAQPAVSVAAPSQANASMTSQGDASSPQTLTRISLEVMGIMSLGMFIGVLVSLVVFTQKTINLKLVTGVIGLVLSGVPTVFLPLGSAVRFVYPIGLLLGVLGARLILGRRDLPKTDNIRHALYLVDSVVIVVVIVVVMYAVATHAG